MTFVTVTGVTCDVGHIGAGAFGCDVCHCDVGHMVLVVCDGCHIFGVTLVTFPSDAHRSNLSDFIKLWSYPPAGLLSGDSRG